MPFSPRMVFEDEDVRRALQVIFVFRNDARVAGRGDKTLGRGYGCWEWENWALVGGRVGGVIRSGLHMLGWSLWKFFLMGRMGVWGTGVRKRGAGV